MPHKLAEASVGSSNGVAYGQVLPALSEPDCTSNATQGAKKQCVDHHRMIDVEQSLSFCDVTALKRTITSKPGSLRGAIAETMTHNTTHTEHRLQQLIKLH